jgi:hypothetical protein
MAVQYKDSRDGQWYDAKIVRVNAKAKYESTLTEKSMSKDAAGRWDAKALYSVKYKDAKNRDTKQEKVKRRELRGKLFKFFEWREFCTCRQCAQKPAVAQNVMLYYAIETKTDMPKAQVKGARAKERYRQLQCMPMREAERACLQSESKSNRRRKQIRKLYGTPWDGKLASQKLFYRKLMGDDSDNDDDDSSSGSEKFDSSNSDDSDDDYASGDTEESDSSGSGDSDSDSTESD